MRPNLHIGWMRWRIFSGNSTTRPLGRRKRLKEKRATASNGANATRFHQRALRRFCALRFSNELLPAPAAFKLEQRKRTARVSSVDSWLFPHRFTCSQRIRKTASGWPHRDTRPSTRLPRLLFDFALKNEIVDGRRVIWTNSIGRHGATVRRIYFKFNSIAPDALRVGKQVPHRRKVAALPAGAIRTFADQTTSLADAMQRWPYANETRKRNNRTIHVTGQLF